VLQQPQNGTGHALLVAKGAIGSAKYVVVLPGDAPLVRTETLRALINKHKKGNAAASILTAVLADPSGYGRILRKSGDTVAAIIEESQLTPEQHELNEINSSMYSFTTAKLWPALAQVKPNNKHREIYLTDAISALNAKGEAVLAEIAENAQETLGCNTRADLAGVDRAFREWKRDELMNSGVTIQLPETVLIDPEVTAGEDTVIEPCVQLLGKTKVGARCVIKTGSVIHDSVLGDNVNFASRLESANKQLGTRICVSATVADATEKFRGRPVGDLMLRGRSEPLRAYEPLSAAAFQGPTTAQYSEAFAKLEAGDAAAMPAFAALVGLHADDALAGFHLRRLLNGAKGARMQLE
jgi:UDP-N-acetylglucosamine diphosphorylase/glucosamine-1-phosphate N-acetyltransferase